MKVQNIRLDLSDVTVLITIRVDSLERKANLNCLLQILQRDYEIKIHVLEADSRQNFHTKYRFNNVKYSFIKDNDPVFHRTKYFKFMQQDIQTPFLAIWDVDAVGIPEQIYETLL